MHRSIKKLAIVAGAAIPAMAILVGAASAAVSPYSKVTNGDFANGKTGWSATKAPAVAGSISQTVGLGKVSNIEKIKGASYAYAYQCFPVMDSVKYELSGKTYISKWQDRGGKANMAILFYSDAACSTQHLASGYTPQINESNTWKKQTLTMTAPKGTKSAMVRLLVHKNAVAPGGDASDPFYAYFDDIQVLQKSIKIPDGPIIKNPQPSPTPPPLPTPPAPQQPEEPEQPQEDPEPAPNPDPAPEPQQPAPEDEPMDQPDDEPVDDPEVTEEDVPGPEVPADNEDDSDGDSDGGEIPAGADSDDGSGPGTGQDADNGAGEAQSTVETLGGAEEESKPNTTGSDNAGAATPGAPVAGTGPVDDSGLIGMRELGLMAGGAAGVMVLAFLVAARGRGRREDDEYIIGQ